MAGGGLATSIVVFAVGAVLRFALTVNTYQHGFNIHTIGVILMIVGAVGAVLSLIAMMSMGWGGIGRLSTTGGAILSAATIPTFREERCY